ncbi:MAG: hypothetical protein ABIH51_01355 [Patescibacteria group bacterium]
MFRKIDDGSVTKKSLQKFLETPGFSAMINDWKKFYKDIFNLQVDFSEEPIPEADDVFFWLICIPENFSTEQVFSGVKQQFKTWKHTDESLDNVLDLSFGRDAKKESYIIRVKPNWEADEDLKNISANQIQTEDINTITLKECILLHRFIYWKHKKHLDIENVTLCSGSRYSVGDVPDVCWSSGYDRFRVSYFPPDSASPGLRARRAVS